MATISLCMIVKNEAVNLDRCLASVTNVVDEIIIVDTGSTDNTPVIAEKYAVKLIKIPWNNNFSEARNTSLEAATGDWILFLDADEQLTEAVPDALANLTTNITAEGYFFKIINVLGSESAPEYSPDVVFRMFRNKRDYRFDGAIHEQILPAINKNYPQALLLSAKDIIIYHYGYLESQITDKSKIDRNLQMVETALATQPDNKLLQYQYGVELYRAGQYDQAVKVLQTAAQGIPNNTSYLPKLIRQLVMSLYKLRQYQQALAYIRQGTALFPDYADLYYFAGLCCFELIDYSNSIKFFRQAIATADQPWHYASFAGIRGFRSYYLLGQLAELFCNEEEALYYYVRSFQNCPTFIAPLQQIIKILVQGEEPDFIGPSLHKLCECCTPASNLLLGKLLLAERCYPLALEYLNNAAANGVNSAESKLLLAICYTQSGDYYQAKQLLNRITSTSSYYPLKLINLAFIRWLADDDTIHFPADISQLVPNSFVPTLKLLTDSDLNSTIRLQPEDSEILLDIIIRGIARGAWYKIDHLLTRIDSAWLNDQSLTIAATYARYLNFAEAERWIDRYRQHCSTNYEALMFLGRLKTKQHQYWEAAQIYREAMSLAPQIPKAYIHLLKTYQELQHRTLQQVNNNAGDGADNPSTQEGS